MSRLDNYVGEALENRDGASTEILSEKLSAIHLALQMLKSTNDTALSDWRGVIGEELKRQEDISSTIDEVYEKLDRLEAMSKERNSSLMELPDALNEVRQTINSAAEMIGSSGPIPIRYKKTDRMVVKASCPKCGYSQHSTLSANPDNPKVISCESCGTYLSVTLSSDGGIQENLIPTLLHEPKCVVCDNVWPVPLPEVDLYNSKTFCPRCGAHYLVHLHQTQIDLKPTGAASPRLLDMIKDTLDGSVPTPERILEISATTGLPDTLVKEAVKLLIGSGQLEADTSSQVEGAGIHERPTENT